MADEILGWKNMATVDEIRKSAWFNKNTDVTDEIIQTYQEKANGDVRTYVSWRYDLKSFTTSRFQASTAYWLLKGCQMLLASAYLLNEWYGMQRLQEENGSKTKYDQQLAILDDIRKWNTRLLDVNLDEFDLAPRSPNQTTPKNVSSSFNNQPPPTFKVWDKW